jgi:hypothetical protein
LTIAINAQNPFRGFFKTTIDKDVLLQDISSSKVLINAPTVIIRPAVSVNFIEVTKSSVQGETFSTKAMQRGGVGLSLAFFKGTENNFSIHALALTPLDLSGSTQFNVSPAFGIELWKFLSFGIGRDTEVKQWFGMIGATYNFSLVK